MTLPGPEMPVDDDRRPPPTNPDSIANPLPRRYFTTDPGIGGKLKQRAEDFIVEEQPLYEPCGEGEHFYLFVEGTNISHAELMAMIRRHFGVRDRAVGFAGMKDKLGITRQMLSVHMPGRRDKPNIDIDHDRIRVLWSDWHRNKLRRGHLAANRFAIRIREVDPTRTPRALGMLRTMEQYGFPAYFGAQRFGYRRNNHLLGAMLLRRDWIGILDELLSTKGTPFPEYQRERRELYEQGRLEEALALWTPADRTERSALNALCRGRNERSACFAAGEVTWSFWISALQSAIFNRVLDQRIDANLLSTIVAGDIAWKHDSRAVFTVSAEDAASPEIHRRTEGLEISPSGPLWGPEMPRASGEVGRIEEVAVEALGIPIDLICGSSSAAEGRRRALRERVRHTGVEGGVDEHGPYIEVRFDLTRGLYATIVLREIMKPDDERSLGA